MTQEECIGLLKRYAEYDGMGIQNLAGCKEAMRMAAELLERPSLPSNLDEVALKELQVYLPQGNGPDGICYFIAPQMLAMYKAGADFGAKNMLAKLRENCVIIDKDLYEIAMEGKFIEGREEGIKWMAEQGETIEGYIAGTNEVAAILAIPRKEYNKGDKVIVQIRKK